jgi:hypothetical protein
MQNNMTTALQPQSETKQARERSLGEIILIDNVCSAIDKCDEAITRLEAQGSKGSAEYWRTKKAGYSATLAKLRQYEFSL